MNERSDPAAALTQTPDWPVIETRVEYETGWFDAGFDLVEQPDGSTKRYYWAALPPAVVVVARDGDQLVFVEQYRPVIREPCLELPAGIVETGETFEDAGARELREETGRRADHVELLETMWVATGVLRHRRGVVLAEGLHRSEPDHDENEFLTTRTVDVDEALATARAAGANDATLVGLLVARADDRL